MTKVPDQRKIDDLIFNLTNEISEEIEHLVRCEIKENMERLLKSNINDIADSFLEGIQYTINNGFYFKEECVAFIKGVRLEYGIEETLKEETQ